MRESFLKADLLQQQGQRGSGVHLQTLRAQAGETLLQGHRKALNLSLGEEHHSHPQL